MSKLNEIITSNAALLLTLGQVAADTGLSERTLCRIASGKPALASDLELVMKTLDLPDAHSVRQHLAKLVETVHLVEMQYREKDLAEEKLQAAQSGDMDSANDFNAMGMLLYTAAFGS